MAMGGQKSETITECFYDLLETNVVDLYQMQNDNYSGLYEQI